MPGDVIEPTQLAGRRVLGVTVGWHIHSDDETPVLYYLSLDGGSHVETHTAGNGSIQLRCGDAPTDYDMGEYGRFEFRDADEQTPICTLIGREITRVRIVRWRGYDIGLGIDADRAHVVVVNDGDDVFLSAGQLPIAYTDAVLE